MKFQQWVLRVLVEHGSFQPNSVDLFHGSVFCRLFGSEEDELGGGGVPWDASGGGGGLGELPPCGRSDCAFMSSSAALILVHCSVSLAFRSPIKSKI